MELQIKRPYHLQPFEDTVGCLHNLKADSPFVIAGIGPVDVLLPPEMEKILSPHLGKRIGVLRTENDYRIRTFDVRSEQ